MIRVWKRIAEAYCSDIDSLSNLDLAEDCCDTSCGRPNVKLTGRGRKMAPTNDEAANLGGPATSIVFSCSPLFQVAEPMNVRTNVFFARA